MRLIVVGLLVVLCAGTNVLGQCGAPDAGNCCQPQFGSPYCNDAACCELICSASPACCNSNWSSSCANLAKNNCHALCGSCGSGGSISNPCCTPNSTPYCYNATCCDSVCAELPHCCDPEGPGWSQECVDMAWQLCPDLPGCAPPACGDAGTGHCCTPNGTPNCNNLTCCNAVCDIDPYCCDPQGEWDECCVYLATQHCGGFPCKWTTLSCEGHCGGSAPGGCWCDDDCQVFEDCCPNYCNVCDSPFGSCIITVPASYSCKNNCGGAAASGCWCDEACCHFGDCCEDKGRHCPGCLYGLNSPQFFGDWCKWCGETPVGWCGCDEGCFEWADCCSTVCFDCPDLAGCTPPSPADLTGNGVVTVFDLLELLSNWGDCQYERCFVMEECEGDFNHDGVVNVFDLLFMLSNWG